MKFKVVKLSEISCGNWRGPDVYAIQCNSGDGWEFVGQAGRVINFPSEMKARAMAAVFERRFPEVSAGEEEDGILEGAVFV